MKEYWVNVYEYPLAGRYQSHGCKTEQYAKQISTQEWCDSRSTLYRLHVRKFDTREAKELYLKMKYGNEFNPYWNKFWKDAAQPLIDLIPESIINEYD